MRKKVSIICLAFLGLLNMSSVSAAEKVSRVDDDFSNGIMKSSFVRSIKDQKKEEAREAAIRAIKTEKEIEINSVNFLKFDKKIGEIFIPNSEVADIEMLSDKSLYLKGLETGTTSLVVHDKEGRILSDFTVRVTHPLKEIKGAISKIFPNLEIEMASIDKSLILTGNVASPEMAQDVLDVVGRFVDQDKIINKMAIETATQVMLKVKVAEVTREVKKSLGVNWRALSATGASSGLIGMAAGDTTAGLPEFSADVDTIKTNLLGSEKTLTNSIGGGRWVVSAGINNLSALIDALASETFATVLAEPNLVALSGKSATFKSGGEQGYTVTQSNSDSKTTEFKDWGTSIEFTPIVLSEDRINIKVKAEVSTLGTKNDDGSPNLTKKEVETFVELGSGQSLALAGLLQTSRDAKSVETPFLSSFPLIGSLFRNSAVNSKENELVIIVTPYIVKPSSKQLKAPTDMVPKMLSPLKAITNRRFHQLGQEADSAGFSLK